MRGRKPFTLNEESVTNQQTRLHHEIAPLASLSVSSAATEQTTELPLNELRSLLRAHEREQCPTLL